MDIHELRAEVRRVVNDPTLTYQQRRHRLAGLAEEALEYPPLSDAAREALDKRIVCDMFEGPAPYRPRYVLPDYERAVHQGSAFLELEAPRDLDEALAFLLMLYSQVPSITGYPVYVGDLDKVLAPFVNGVSDDDLYRKLRLLWLSLDRMFPDAFLHTDFGPDDSRVTRTILRLERELQQVVPNCTMKVDPDRTPDDLVLDGVRTVFACGQPHFVNHPMMVADHGEGYAAVSCYNSLKIGGGSHTLVRLNLKEVVLRHTGDLESFFGSTLPTYVELTAEVIEARVRHLVEEARFFEHSWLVHEGLVDLSRFSAMFGIFGLAEAVDLLMERDGREGTYGHSSEADALSYRLTQTVADLVAVRPMPYCDGGGGRCYLHSQSGIDSDVGVTAGTRIPVGAEPGLYEHLRTVAPHHRLFASGVSDVLSMDDTATRNPQAMVDIIRGALREGMRDVTFNLDSNEFVRVTGYLVRKSDLARAAEGTRHGSDQLAAGAEANTHMTQRAVKRVISQEMAATDPRRVGG
jgi:YjjI family glycine radical enzyme